MKNLVSAAVIALSMFTGADFVSPQTADELQAAKVADDVVAEKIPSYDRALLPQVILDRGDFWDVSYRLPDGWQGGAPHVYVDKRTFSVIKVFRIQ